MLLVDVLGREVDAFGSLKNDASLWPSLPCIEPFRDLVPSFNLMTGAGPVYDGLNVDSESLGDNNLVSDRLRRSVAVSESRVSLLPSEDVDSRASGGAMVANGATIRSGV